MSSLAAAGGLTEWFSEQTETATEMQCGNGENRKLPGKTMTSLRASDQQRPLAPPDGIEVLNGGLRIKPIHS